MRILRGALFTGVAAIAVLLLALVFQVQAGTIGDPTETLGPGRFSLGVELDFTERDLEVEGTTGVREFESRRYMAKGAIGLLDGLDLFLKVGLADAGNGGFNGDLGLGGGGGIRLNLFPRDVVTLGLLLQFLTFTSENSEEVEWREWDLAFGASYRGIKGFTPYGGLLISMVDGDLEERVGGQLFRRDLEEDETVGAFLGMSISLRDRIDIGLEARFFHESSISAFVSYRF